MDQSESEVRSTAHYGSSDNTRPSFNRMSYVRYGSVNTPRDLGKLDNVLIDLDGLVGAESGTQTLFFEFELTKRSRVGLRRIPINPYTDQYVSLFFNTDDKKPIPLGLDNFATFGSIVDQVFFVIVIVDIGYVLCGYWDSGYAENDCQFIQVVVPVIEPIKSEDDPFESIYGDYLPPGIYRFLISSSQWPELPYRVQLKILGEPNLAGDATMSLEPTTRLPVSPLGGVIDMSAQSTGRLAVVIDLSGELGLETRPVATIDRVSPFG
jgi:hypothetical protein